MKWYIGQEIVAIENHSQGAFKKGDTFIVKGLQNSHCKCGGKVIIDIGLLHDSIFMVCPACYTFYKSMNKWWFSEKMFAPLDYDISELTDILEKPIELINK
jgi:hypothetical protein